MKRFNLIQFLFVFLFSLPISAQEYGLNYNPQDDFQIKTVSSNGEIYAVKLAKDKKMVEETMFIDLNNDKNRVTYYNEDGFPSETYEGDKLYTYYFKDAVAKITSSESYEDIKLQQDADLALLKEKGVNLSFMDKFVADNESWLDNLSSTNKLVDWTLENIAYTETAFACGFAVMGNPLMAIPCASGLINFVGNQYNATDPTTSKVLTSFSSGVDMMHDYVKDGKTISSWQVVKELVDKTDQYYDEKKAKLHECAELIRQDIRDEADLYKEQKYSGEGDIDQATLNPTGGIVQTAVNKIIALKKEQETAKNSLTEIYKKGDKEAMKKVIAKIDQIEADMKEVRKKAETDFNDSINDKKMSVSWKKLDSEVYYKVKNIYFTGIRWHYGDKPDVLLDLNIKFSPKNVRQISGDEISTHQANIRHITIYSKRANNNEDWRFRLIVGEKMRSEEVIHTALNWDDFLVTPYIVFKSSEF